MDWRGRDRSAHHELGVRPHRHPWDRKAVGRVVVAVLLVVVLVAATLALAIALDDRTDRSAGPVPAPTSTT